MRCFRWNGGKTVKPYALQSQVVLTLDREVSNTYFTICHAFLFCSHYFIFIIIATPNLNLSVLLWLVLILLAAVRCHYLLVTL